MELSVVTLNIVTSDQLGKVVLTPPSTLHLNWMRVSVSQRVNATMGQYKSSIVFEDTAVP